MAWVRLTVVTPRQGAAEDVRRLLNELEEATAELPGFLMGGVFADAEGDRLGRFALWASKEDADKASATDRVMVLRADIHLRIEEGHLESLFQVSGASHGLPGG